MLRCRRGKIEKILIYGGGCAFFTASRNVLLLITQGTKSEQHDVSFWVANASEKFSFLNDPTWL